MRTALITSLFSAALALGASAQAATPQHGFTPEESKIMAAHNEKVAANAFVDSMFNTYTKNTDAITVTAAETMPWAEYHTAGYVIISDQITFNSLEAKRTIAKNLPADVTLVVFTGISNKKTPQTIIDAMAPYIPKERLKVIYLPTGKRGFWARDGVPVPTLLTDVTGAEKFAVTDAKYYHEFEADKEIANYFGADLLKHDYYHEGGNFAATANGHCAIVDNERAIKIPPDIFETKYGCKTLLRLPHIKGIGHIDESFKFVDDSTVIVDNDTYEKAAKKAGFTTIRIPRPTNDYETYVNALIVNGTAFVPVFNQATDAAAIKVYEDLGNKVIPINSTSLSNDGLGSIHCITMAYPPVPFKDLVTAVGGTTTP